MSDRCVEWVEVGNPVTLADKLPPERKAVLVFVEGNELPYCAYVRYAAGDKTCPYFVVYHGSSDKSTTVKAWCDCLPTGPKFAKFYNSHYEGRGFPANNPKETVS